MSWLPFDSVVPTITYRMSFGDFIALGEKGVK